MRSARLPELAVGPAPSEGGAADTGAFRARRTRDLCLFEATPTPTAVLWSESGELQLNDAARELLGVGPESVGQGASGRRDALRSFAALLGAAEPERAERALEQTLEQTLAGQALGPTRVGVVLGACERTLLLESRPVFDREGRVVGAMATARDVTDEALDAELADQLLGRAAHDLRTPLTALKASAQLVARGLERLDAAARARTLHLMLAQVEKLAGRIDDVVDAARIRRGRWDVSLEELDLAQVMPELVRELERGRTPSIALTVPPAAPVRADRARIAQLVARLAADAAERRAPLSVEVTPGGELVFDVAGAPLQRTTRRLADTIAAHLGGRTEEPCAGRLIVAFPAPNTG